MLVKEIAVLAAANMGREDLQQLAENCKEKPVGEVASLLRCYNLVENRLAMDYFPLYRTERFCVAKDGFLPFTRFSLAPVSVKRVTKEGAPVDFSVRAEGIQTAGGEVEVTYSYSPAEKGWQERSELSGRISARLLSYGVASEFCLTAGLFGESAMWEQRFQSALRAADVPRRRLKVRARRWV